MTVRTRYAGRLGGDGIDDSLSGPETVKLAFAGDVLIIADPLSFPWHLASEDDWFTGVVVDLRNCSEDDMVALYEVLPLLTPSDKLVLRDDQRPTVLGQLRLPESVVLNEIPSNINELLESDKAAQVLLREGIERALEHGLNHVVSGGRVVDCAAPHHWLSAIVPKGHDYVSIPQLKAIEAESTDVLVQWGAVGEARLLQRAQRTLRSEGMLVFVLNADDVASATPGTPNVQDLLAALDQAFGQHHVVELVWGMRGRPGTPPRGAVIAIRPLRISTGR